MEILIDFLTLSNLIPLKRLQTTRLWDQVLKG